MDRPYGFVPVVNVKEAVVGKLMVPVVENVFKKKETILAPLFAIATSGLPSLSKSPITTPRGVDKPVKLIAEVVKLIVPIVDILCSIEAVVPPLFPTTTSGRLSLSKSPIAKSHG